MRLRVWIVLAHLAVTMPAAAQDKPNIVIIWGDDVGYWNISAYNQGMMGYETPNIDRIAEEGVLFTDAYGEQSCTAGRAAFITGQHPYRTGLLKVGLPGAEEGMSTEDPTIATFLKDHGYATGQFGKNHLGRPRRASADEPRLRRVLRQPVPLERRGGAGERRLPQRPGVPGRVRPARRHPQLRRRPHRGHRTADEKAHGNRGRRVSRSCARLHRHGQGNGTSRSSCGSTRRGCTCGPTSNRSPTGLPASASTRTAWSSTTAHVGRLLDKLDELGICRRHYRDVLHRQRRGDVHVARRRHDAVPR